MPNSSEPRPASTVVLLRDTPEGMQTLLLKRNKALAFAGGLWVFPGGAIDADDMAKANGDVELAARYAAAREAVEESGLQPAMDDIIQLSHWTTPVVEPKRFYTWIFAAPVASDDEVVIDGGEIHDSMWIDVKEAVARHEQGDLAMLPPTYVTLMDISRHADVAQLLDAESNRTPDQVFPIFGENDGAMVVMFRGDAGYEDGNGELTSSQHRAVFNGTRWDYIYQSVDAQYPPLVKQR